MRFSFGFCIFKPSPVQLNHRSYRVFCCQGIEDDHVHWIFCFSIDWISLIGVFLESSQLTTFIHLYKPVHLIGKFGTDTVPVFRGVIYQLESVSVLPRQEIPLRNAPAAEILYPLQCKQNGFRAWAWKTIYALR